MKNIDQEALKYHQDPPGKIGTALLKSSESAKDLALAYSPGVAAPCLKIAENEADAYKYTNKGNLVAVMSNGTSVLGLGNIGALAGKPVMEGKALLFKRFANVNAVDIEIDETDPEKFVAIAKAIAPSFGGINLEDIKAPECFEIEEKLKAAVSIPVFHDDQHGTAIIVLAGLLNACEITSRKLADVSVVMSGAGAAAIAIGKLLKSFGVTNIKMFDSKGLITTKRKNLPSHKQEFAVDNGGETLPEALIGTDIFVGVSRGNLLQLEDVRKMNDNPIIFALANPTPEIGYELVKKHLPGAIMATGRSDFPNQVNNVLCFPFLFRGALDVRASAITENMKKAAVHAIAELAKEPVPKEVVKAYDAEFTFGKDYILPKPFDARLLDVVSNAVKKAAKEDGVTQVP